MKHESDQASGSCSRFAGDRTEEYQNVQSAPPRLWGNSLTDRL